ncbi:MAG: metallophosphoesterase [Muribaculaceae bacterium]
MDRRKFLKDSALAAAAVAIAPYAKASEVIAPEDNKANSLTKLIDSAPMLQNYAETSIGITFSVTDYANGYVEYGLKPDLSDAKRVKCGGYRVTGMNNQIIQVRLTGLQPATRYYYRIGADRISYGGGYSMKIAGNETDSEIYSFTTAGKKAQPHFCVINDTHAHWDAIAKVTNKIAELSPSCVIWNGDACNTEETVDAQKQIFLKPNINRKDYAASTPYLFCPGNHDLRGMANRHLERVWMYRQPEERLSRDWDLGRNFAVRMGDIALIGLDTAEDKQDTNPLFAGLYNSHEYRKAQTEWLKNALAQKEIADAPFIVAFCHIPLFDNDPTHNPGDIAPADKDPAYTEDYALWQRTCANMWTPLLQKAGCRVIITAHMHEYRFDAPSGNRKWAQIVGGGPKLKSKRGYPTVIEGLTQDGQLVIRVHNVATGIVEAEHRFKTK